MIFHQPLDEKLFPHAHEYVILSKKQETPTITTLFLARIDGIVPDYHPGQCITVYFPDLSPTLGKQYSISSAPCEGTFSITVKAMGRFSHRICSLKTGDTILTSEPEGDLYSLTSKRIVVMLAGGMGVTPFRSMLLQAATDQTLHRMILLHSGKYINDTPFLEELYLFAQYSPMLIIKQFLTQERLVFSGIKNRRIQIQDILQAVNGESAEYLICGSLSFVLGLKNILLEAGIERVSIHTEAH